MKLLFAFLLILPWVALAEEHSAGRKVGVSTEGIYSEPYKRASLSVETKGWALTPGYVSSEDRRFGFVLGGYRFKREMEHAEMFLEPHVGFANGSALGNTAVLGGRFELESRKWMVASWVDTYRGGKINFTTCEPLAEAVRHVGGGLYFGATSSCYLGPGLEPEQTGEHHAAPTHPEKEYLYYVGPTASWRKGKILLGVAYEIGKHQEKFLSGYVSIRWR